MPSAQRGEVWLIDFGLAAKVRPALVLTLAPADNELALVTVVLHTTALRGNPWEITIPKPFLQRGAFHLQQIQSVSAAKLMRCYGTLTVSEMAQIDTLLRRRLNL